MKIKLFEVRDHATFIGVFAFRPTSEDRLETGILKRCGWHTQENASEAIYLGVLSPSGEPVHYDPYDQPHRTLRVAHHYIAEHFDTLESGAVIDVEFISGEVSTPKESECN
jgi:hypothetical protein